MDWPRGTLQLCFCLLRNFVPSPNFFEVRILRNEVRKNGVIFPQRNRFAFGTRLEYAQSILVGKFNRLRQGATQELLYLTEVVMNVEQVFVGPDLRHLHPLGNAVVHQKAVVVGVETPVEVLSPLLREARHPRWTVAWGGKFTLGAVLISKIQKKSSHFTERRSLIMA